MNDIHLPYKEELGKALSQGAEFLTEMIRTSVFGNKELPPPEMFKWYVMKVAYQFAYERGRVKHGIGSEELLTQLTEELKAIQIILQDNKQFSLQAAVNDVIKISEMSL